MGKIMSVFCALIMIKFGQVNDIYISMKGGEEVSRRKIESPEQMAELWEKFKEKCDSKTVVRTEFSQKLGKFVSETLPSPVTYTVVGFCVFCGISREVYYSTYSEDPEYSDIVYKINTECESDVREKLENRTIPTQLSGLWMSKFGYATKTESEIKGNVPVVIAGEDELSE